MSKWGSATPKERESAPASVFCGPNRSFPVVDKADFDNAVHALGRASGDTSTIKQCMIGKAKANGWDLPDTWKTEQKDVSGDATLLMFGSAVKALGEGKVSGYLVTFGDETTPDLSDYKDYFSKSTDFDIEDGEKRSIYFAHGQDPNIGKKKIGRLTVKTDDVGVWVEGILDQRDDYERALYALAEKGKLGWSSGAPAHLVERKAIGAKDHTTAHEIIRWPISEGSLTPTPAEWRGTNTAIALKSLSALIGIAPEAEAKDGDEGIYYELRDHHEDGDEGRDDQASDEWMADDAVETTKHADVSAIKAALGQSMPFSDHADIATSAMEGFVTRAAALSEMSTKAGRVISGANRDKLKRIHAGMTTAHTAMAGHLEAINAMLLSTDPDAKKMLDELDALRTQSLRLQSAHLRLTA